MSVVPEIRIRPVNQAPVRADGDFVLYWMIANRRVNWNFSLDRALEWCRQLGKPLLIFEPLRIGYQWASVRLHRFVLQGMADHREALQGTPAGYFPYIEPQPGAGKGLLEALAQRACVVVTDEFPCFFLPAMVASAARRLDVLTEAIDSNGLLPLRATEAVFPTAYAFRRFLQKKLPDHFGRMPQARPLDSRTKIPGFRAIPEEIARRWSPVAAEALAGGDDFLQQLQIDQIVGPAAFSGGSRAAGARLKNFLRRQLVRYEEDRNHPDANGTSGLSPYLHFGHISAHEVFMKLTEAEAWSPASLGEKTAGSREGWWGMSPSAEAFLDQLVTWRELGFNLCAHRRDYNRYESLPDWALRTLDVHASDPRPVCYELEELEAARTYDPIWNAAQRELVRTGAMQNSLRMLWGKKILEWAASPQKALAMMIELNNKYAVDGRDPNSYSGIFWVLGRYDRAWGPERPIFGKVRYMSSENSKRKWRMGNYLQEFGEQG